MKTYLLILISIILLLNSSCGPQKPQPLSAEQVNKEKEAIIEVIKKFNEAYQTKNFSPIIDLLSKDVIFFGTDSAEVIKSLAEFQEELQKQWKVYDSIIFGNIVDMSIIMDNNASFASVIYGIPCDLISGDKQEHLFLRYARTLKKENNRWVIVSGIVGATTKGLSNTELYEQRMKQMKEGKK